MIISYIQKTYYLQNVHLLILRIFLFVGPAPGTVFNMAFNTDEMYRDRGFYANWYLFENPKEAEKGGFYPIEGTSTFLQPSITKLMPFNEEVLQPTCKPITSCPRYCFHGFIRKNGCLTCECVEENTGELS